MAVPTGITANGYSNSDVGLSYSALFEPTGFTGGSVQYDANGNLVTDQNGMHYTYDVANRMVSAGVAGGTEYYQYTADNKRVVTYAANGTATVFTYGAFGEKLATGNGGIYNHVYFAGRLIVRDALAGQALDSYFVAVDRLGSVRTTASFLPYGEEISATANGTVKFATYTRDASTGLDYADQRYYTSQFGRFMSADRFKQAAKANDSGSWNKYSYTRGDPVNRIDPHGTEDWCDDNPEDCEPPCVGQAFLGSCGEAGGGDGPDPGGGGSPLPSEPQCPLFKPVGNFKVGDADAEFAYDMVVKVDAAIKLLNSEGINDVIITSGFRNPDRQKKVIIDPGNFGKADRSWHEVGEAIDLNIYNKATGKWNPNANDIIYAFEVQGLTWGGDFKNPWDPVHFQNASGGVYPSTDQIANCEKEHP